MGLEFSFMSLFGVVALSGVVMNSSRVLVDNLSRRGREGDRVEQAIFLAEENLFRSILRTSRTTFAGLKPILLEDRLRQDPYVS